MYVFNLPISKWSQLLHWNLFLLIEITMRSKSPPRTAESLKLGHTMTFAWHFCYGACFCFPCCPECIPLSSTVIQTSPSKLRPNPFLMNTDLTHLEVPVALLSVSHNLCTFHCRIQYLQATCSSLSHMLTFPENVSAPMLFTLLRSSQYLMQYHNPARNQVLLLDAIICTNV